MNMFLMMIITEFQNPLDGITPDASVFGVEFESTLAKLLGGAWAVFAALAAAGMMKGGAEMWRHRGGGHPGELEAAQATFKNAAIGMGVLIGLPIIIGAGIAVLS